MDAIRVEELDIEYPRRRGGVLRAVSGLTFRVARGEIVGFLGLNGAGKTSTLKALLGFQPVARGRAELFDVPVSEAGARGHVGFLPETALYSPHITPWETLWLYGQLHGIAGRPLHQRIGEVLEQVGLSGKERVLNRTLSKGMLQRVGIAQAILSRPRLLLLDEVSSGLDPLGRRDLRELLRQQQQDGATVFFSSHQLLEAEQLCDRILIIHEGSLVAERTMSQVRAAAPSLEHYFVQMVERQSEPLTGTAG